MFITVLFIIARKQKQPKCPSTDEWRCATKKKKICYMNTMRKLLSHKKEKNWVLYNNVNTSRICHMQWCKSEREKHCTLTLICVTRNMVEMNLYAVQQQRHRCREKTCRYKGDGEGVMNCESRIDIYTLPCVKQIARGKLLYTKESSAWCSVMTREGRNRRKGARARRICVCVYIQINTYSRFTSLYSKNYHNNVKQLYLNNRI